MKYIMLSAFVTMGISIFPWVATAQQDDVGNKYDSLRESYLELKNDPVKRKYREHWSRIGNGLIQLADANKESPIAPRALFTAAELYRDLRRITVSPNDLEFSIELYGRVESEYPSSNLADDALYWKAMLLRDVKGDEPGACKTLSTLVSKHRSGDMVSKATTMLADCPISDEKVENAAAKAAEAPVQTQAQILNAATHAIKPSEPQVKKDERVVSTPNPTPEKNGELQKTKESAMAPIPSTDPQSATPSKPSNEKPPAAPAVLPAATEKASPMIVAMKDGMKAKIKDGTIKEGIPLTEQLGLKFKRIVIDPGHGGEDTGATGKKKTKEKDVALAIAKKLAKKLRDELKVEVVMTRTEDQTVSLPERTALARAVKADLFISIHANANPNRKFRGIETFYLNNTDDRAAQKVAAMENASLEAGISDLRMTLLDLALSANVDDSIRLANLIQRNTVETLRQKYADVKDLGVKYALFYVLFGTEVPSVLIETSFISNPVEEQRLKDPKYQEKLANGIYLGIKKYIGDRTVSAKYK